MNKKIFSVLVSVLFLLNSSGIAFAEKKDVILIFGSLSFMGDFRDIIFAKTK